jgi:hypothetical protein
MRARIYGQPFGSIQNVGECCCAPRHRVIAVETGRAIGLTEQVRAYGLRLVP